MRRTTGLFLSLIIILSLLVACAAQEPTPTPTPQVDPAPAQTSELPAAPAPQGTDDPHLLDNVKPAPVPDTVSTPTSTATSAPVKEFDVIAKQWEFVPNPIEVNKGDKVILHITSKDVTHGFALPEFGVNERLVAGSTTDIEFVATQAGSFTFFCNVQCGSGHSSMKGQLIVH